MDCRSWSWVRKVPTEFRGIGFQPVFSADRLEAYPTFHVPTVYCCAASGQERPGGDRALRFTHVTADKKHARFKLSGSKTGPDGEGDTDHEFNSASGRIFIAAHDWGRPSEKVPPDPPAKLDWQPLAEPRQLVWHVLPDSLDMVLAIRRGDPTPTTTAASRTAT